MANAFEEYGFEARVATREAVPALIALWGPSGSGKTYSALLLARGLVGPQGKIAVLDTENGRARFYADVAAPWIHLDIQPPFTPDKYSQAFRFLRQEHGAQAIVVDSMSHVWEGEGGVLDMANQNGKTGLLKWMGPKLAHKKMVNDLMRSPIHVIFCVRQKDVMKTVRVDNKDQYVFDRFTPISEKNFIFEMTVALRLMKNGFYDAPLHEAYYKVPAGLHDCIPLGGQVTEQIGKDIADWLAGGTPIDKALYDLIDKAQGEADKGLKAYQEFWANTPPAQKKKLQSRHEGFKTHAADVDTEKQREADYAKAGGAFTPSAEPTQG